MDRTEPFWETLANYGNAVALEHAESGQSWSYRELAGHVDATREIVSRPGPGVAFVFADSDLGGIVNYLACLRAGHAVYLLPIKSNHPAVVELMARFRPEILLSQCALTPVAMEGCYSRHSTSWNYQVYIRDRGDAPAPNPDLALLLSTSASTGNPKTIRISTTALAASARQVVDALHITPDDHAVTSLPFTYVYGLSVINSHLAAGARISLEKHTVADPEFWRARLRSPWTTLAGVSVTYELMRQGGVAAETLAGVRKLLHSGSRMPADLFSWLYACLDSRRSNLYLMYGQTEACGRMSVLQPQMLPAYSAAAGTPVCGGRFVLSGENEILYSGPNVMLGYASSREDLDARDQMHGVLPTGDCGYLDADGMLYVTGRHGRICKPFGQRICLDDIEEFFYDVGPTAALCRGEHIYLFSEASALSLRVRLVPLAKTFRVPPQLFVICPVHRLPRTASGKIRYAELGECG
jgi:acyl-coenzyme A synthetase/AMP-(fatty) acid ligase